MDTSVIRRAQRADIRSLLALEAQFPSDALKRRNLGYLLRRSTAEVWVYEMNGDVVAEMVLLFRARSRVARLYSLVVDPAQRGRGIGRALLALAEDTARSRRTGVLALEVRTDNAQALALYRRAGFEVVERLDDYYDDGTEAFRMRKRIAADQQPTAQLCSMPSIRTVCALVP